MAAREGGLRTPALLVLSENRLLKRRASFVCPVLGPSPHEVEDEHHEQDDDEKTDQSVAGSGDGKHVALLVMTLKSCRSACSQTVFTYFQAFANPPVR